MFSTLLLLAAVALDALLGEPRRYHPLVGFGRLADGLERALYGGEEERTVPLQLLRRIPQRPAVLLYGGEDDLAVLTFVTATLKRVVGVSRSQAY